MNTLTATALRGNRVQARLVYRILFLVYLVLSAYTIGHHELWADEMHSWNIAKGSACFANLISNTRYEGHPPVWYTLLWILAKFTHNLRYVQGLHWLIAGMVAAGLLFRSPFSPGIRLLLPFGYFFLYEYAALSRNYAIGILLVFELCRLLGNKGKQNIVLYYVWLFLLSNTHLLGVLLAGSLHLYFLLQQKEKHTKNRQLLLHTIGGLILLLPALWFIAPPSNSEMNTGFWASHWNVRQLMTLVQLPLRSFIPIPAWWKYNWWNTTFLLEGATQYPFLKLLNPLLSLGLLALACLLLRRHKKSLLLFLANFAATCLVSLVFPLNSARYAGFIFIGFVAAYWLYCTALPAVKSRGIYMVYGLLIVQLLAAIPAVVKDWVYPFSNSFRVKELLREVPPQSRAVTDYWALNTISSYADTSFYCIDLQKEVAYILWTSDFAAMIKQPHPFYSGVTAFFQQQPVQQVYFLSVNPPAALQHADSLLGISYKVTLVDSREGAIEPGSNLYLYTISLH